MHQPVRILQVFSSLDRGGAETMIMNIYRNIDRKKVQFDFIVEENSKNYDYELEIKQLGGSFYVPKYKVFNYLHYRRIWKKLLNQHSEWNIIHIHHTSTALIYLRIIKYFNKITIIHSHTAGAKLGMKSILKIIMRYPLRYMGNYLFACSDLAAKWMFGNHNTSTHILKNSIDAQKYIFSEKERQVKRKEFNIQNKFVIGHIGNFSKAKNYMFILEIFQFIMKENNQSILILVGENKNKPEVEDRVKEMGLEKQVIFTGVRADISNLLQAMDVFLFPSLFEGLGMVLIEAQASGLKCIASDTIPKEVKITDEVEFIALDKSPKYWSDQILLHKNGYDRKDTFNQIHKAGYDIEENVRWLQNFYLKIYNSIRD